MVSTVRCGRTNPGSIPGAGKFFLISIVLNCLRSTLSKELIKGVHFSIAHAIQLERYNFEVQLANTHTPYSIGKFCFSRIDRGFKSLYTSLVDDIRDSVILTLQLLT